MARKTTADGEMTVLNNVPPKTLEDADVPEDGLPHVVDEFGNVKTLSFPTEAGEPKPFVVKGKAKAEPPPKVSKFVVTKGGPYKCRFNVGTTKLVAGQVVDENGHDVDDMRRQGIKLRLVDDDADTEELSEEFAEEADEPVARRRARPVQA